MTEKKSPRDRLARLRSLMDEKGLPHGIAPKAPRPEPLRGVHVREKVFPADYRHGEVVLDELTGYGEGVFRTLGGHESFETFRPEEAVFLDTETTGLAGGAGTYAFLVGIGFYREESFVVRQFLMPELSEEKEMLELLARELQPFRSLVTFNGMAFDMPLLHTRYIMQGLRPSWSWEHHLDLLPLARKLWRGRFESCRLACLEERVAGFRRVGDIPGYAIPALYVRFLQERRLSLLEPVITHNVWDIVSLAALAASACRLLEKGEGLDLEEGWDFAAAGRAFDAVDASDLSLACYREALEYELPEEKRRAVFHAVGMTLKSRGRWEEAGALWEQARREFSDDFHCRTELAKYLEHRLKDPEAALEPALEARKIAARQASDPLSARPPVTRVRESERRVERLREKLERLESEKSRSDEKKQKRRNSRKAGKT